MTTLRYVSNSGAAKDIPLVVPKPHSLGSAVLVDMHSLKVLAEEFRGRGSGRVTAHYTKSLKTPRPRSKEDTRQLLEVLSLMVCFDRILLNSRAIKSLQEGDVLLEALHEWGLLDAVELLDFPEELYLGSALHAYALRGELDKVGTKRRKRAHSLAQKLGLRKADGADDYVVKDMYDGYRNRHFVSPARPIFNIGQTGETVERLLVYLDMANWLDVPATLSRAKYRAAVELNNSLRALAAESSRLPCRATLISEYVQDTLAHHALGDETLTVPPLPGYICQVARERKLTIVDATKWVRNSPGAAAFRDWLWTKRRLCDPTFASEILERKALENHLKDIGERIASEGEARGIFVRRSSITVRPFQIPAMGFLLKALGADAAKSVLEKLEFKLPLVSYQRRPLYEVFMAEWFGSAGKPLA